MKRMLKIMGGLIVFVAVLIVAFYYANNEDLPTGKQGAEADALAHKMLKAIHNEAYKTTRFIEWSFREKHFYKWDKKKNIVEVTWDNNKVILHTKHPEKSEVFIDEKQTFRVELIDKAILYFKNDRFWLIAPHTVFDKNVERRLVQHNNKNALLVTYKTENNTLGDSYLWILDDNNIPIRYKMWVSISPTNGMDATWEDWITTNSGTKLPKNHKLKKNEINMGNVKAYN